MRDETTRPDYQDFVLQLLEEEEKKTPEMLQSDLLYTSVLSEYLRQQGRKIGEDNEDVIPIEFQLLGSNDAKIRILNDAIEKQIPIQKSELYLDTLEGVRDENFFKGRV